MSKHHLEGFLETKIQEGIATISFGHPASNSLPSLLLNNIAATFTSLNNNKEVMLIILKSTGNGAFCAGASFDELLMIKNQNQATAFFSGFANVILAMRSCSKIIIGQIHGKSVGGGLGLIAGCDYAIATKEASIKLSELAIGIGPFVIEPAVRRKIGLTAFAELTLETDWKTATWALDKGLYSKIVDNQEALEVEAAAFASKIASYNPNAVASLKKIFWKETENWQTELFERATLSGELVLLESTQKKLQSLKR